MTNIALETHIQAPREACFALSLSVDAHTSSMRRSSEQIVAGVRQGEMSAGETVTWRARHFGVPWRMTSLISAYERPARFVDEQTAGPFRSWWHEHRFEETPTGTTMIDEVEFSSPLGILGRFANWLVLERYMTRLLTERNRWLREELERPAA